MSDSHDTNPLFGPGAHRDAEPGGQPSAQPSARPSAQPSAQPHAEATRPLASAPAWRPAPPTAPYMVQPPGTHAPASGVDARPRPRRAVFAASVLTGALVLGGGAGLGGAAAYDAWLDDDGGAAGPSSTPISTSRVVDSNDAPALDGSVEAVAARVLPSVVKIDVLGDEGSGSGSGIIVSSDGQILTNNHVVEVAAAGGSMRVTFHDGTHAEATVLGTDPLTDTAVIQAQDVTGLTPATIGTSGDLAVGQGVVAVGSPLGLEATVTSGIVSALDRPVNVGSDGQGNNTVYPAIQTDAAINPGNSGGALTDMNGNVVGINASIATAGQGVDGASGSIGLGFAIPIDEVLPIVDQMAAGETPTHARMGVSVSNVGATAPGVEGELQGAPRDLSTTDGAQVQEVDPGSTAADAGIAEGDVVTKVDDHLITGADSLVATIRSYRPGDTVRVTYLRDGEERTVELNLDSDVDSSDS